MTPDEVKDLLLEALERPAAERAAFVARRCGDDLGASAHVRALLAAHERGEGRLRPAAGGDDDDDGDGDGDGDGTVSAPTLAPGLGADSGPPVPREIAGRRIIRVLGEGGYGRVYLAQETEPIARRVAIKIIRPGLDTPDVLARFEAERRALGMMKHPGIAAIIDAGRTPDGLPYVVMEHVDGEPITSFCRRHALSLRARVELLERTCLAVHHAHTRGVIHRDVKPSNLLVTETDDTASPKVIDFGIAKALQGSEAADGPNAAANAAAAVTGTRQMIGTPQYMPPEQATLGRADVDTRSDVYALGVVLHECLAGLPPFDPRRLAAASSAELERIIRDEHPPPPSARVVDREDLSETERQRLARRLRGELDWIVQRATEKEPARRYPSAAAMARDLRHWLDGRAVDAGPPSGLYRLRKSVVRHRLEVGSAAAILLLVVAASIISLVLAARADDARELAEQRRIAAEAEAARYAQIADFTQAMIGGIDPAVARGADTTLLARMLEDAEARLAADPPEDAEAAGTIGLMIALAHRSLGDLGRAAPLAEEAAARIDAALGPLASLSLEARSAVAAIMGESGRFAEAADAFRQIHERRRELHGPGDARTLESLSNVGVLMHRLGRTEAAVDAHRDVLDHRRRTLGPDDPDTAATMNNLAMAFAQLGRLEEAADMLAQTLGVQTRVLGEDHPYTLATRNNLAASYRDLGRLEDARREFEATLRTKEIVLPAGHPSRLSTMSNLGDLQRAMGDLDAAETLLGRALAEAQASAGDDDPQTAIIRVNLAAVQGDRGRPDEGLQTLEPALAVLAAMFGEDHARSISASARLARLLAATGRTGEAATVIARILPRADGTLAGDAARMAAVLDAAAAVADAIGDPAGARDHLLRRHAILLDRFGPDDARVAAAEAALADREAAGGDAAADPHGDAAAEADAATTAAASTPPV